jgi:hypothetical protein
MCAPGDQRKSNDNQREQAELNPLQRQQLMLQEEARWATRKADLCDEPVSREDLL